MKSRYVRSAAGVTSNSRAGFSSPAEKVNSNTRLREPPPTYTSFPSGENARPSQPSARGTRAISLAPLIVSTLTEGGLYPPFSTSRNAPSGDTADDIGSVSSGICAPAGWIRQPVASMKLPSGSAPTCSRHDGCGDRIAAQTTTRAKRRYFIRKTSVRSENGARCRTPSW